MVLTASYQRIQLSFGTIAYPFAALSGHGHEVALDCVLYSLIERNAELGGTCQLEVERCAR